MRAKSIGISVSEVDDNVKKRFEQKIRKEDAHWFWTAAANSAGIPVMTLRGRRMPPASHISVALDGREVQPFFSVYSTCEHKHCLNPKHLDTCSTSDLKRKTYIDNLKPFTREAREMRHKGFSKKEIIDKTGLSEEMLRRVLNNTFDPDDTYTKCSFRNKFSTSQVITMREEHLNGKSGATISKESGRPPASVSEMLHGKCFAHLPNICTTQHHKKKEKNFS